MAKRGSFEERNEVQKLKNLGEKIATYRQCAGIPHNIFAERCGVSVQVLSDVENGLYKAINVQQILRFAEELSVSYYDLYEAENEQYYANVKDKAAFTFILDKAKEYSVPKMAQKLDININSFYSFRHNKYISSPFVLSNIMALLKINSATLRNAGIYNEKPAKETPKESKAPDVDALNEVIKAVNVYKNVDTLKAELNEIISKAQNLLNMLGA